MGWATSYIQDLKAGKTVQFRPRGNSMHGKITSGQLVTVSPQTEYQVGDIVLCSVRGTHFLHLIKAENENQFQIGNNKGYINGWTPKEKVYGKCILVED